MHFDLAFHPLQSPTTQDKTPSSEIWGKLSGILRCPYGFGLFGKKFPVTRGGPCWGEAWRFVSFRSADWLIPDVSGCGLAFPLHQCEPGFRLGSSLATERSVLSG